MFGALKRGFRSMASLILVSNVVSELRPKRTLAASRGFLAAARLSCYIYVQNFAEKLSAVRNYFRKPRGINFLTYVHCTVANAGYIAGLVMLSHEEGHVVIKSIQRIII